MKVISIEGRRTDCDVASQFSSIAAFFVYVVRCTKDTALAAKLMQRSVLPLYIGDNGASPVVMRHGNVVVDAVSSPTPHEEAARPKEWSP